MTDIRYLAPPTLDEAVRAFAAAQGAARILAGGTDLLVQMRNGMAHPGTIIDIPLAHKDALYVRSHYDTVSAMFGDGPNRDEVVLIWAFATRGRLNARLGGLKASEIKGADGLV